MFPVLLTLHMIVCLALVAVVLVQSGTKGGGLAGGAFGGATQTVFGGRGANDFITRATIVLGVTFFLSSVLLARLSSNSGTPSRSLMQEAVKKAQSAAPTGAPANGQAAPSGTAPSTAPAPAGTAPPPPPGGGK